MPGHLFVVHADLLLLSCDAVVLPCDSAANVSGFWKLLLPPEKVSPGPWPGWLSVAATLETGRAMVQAEPLRVDIVDTVSPLQDGERQDVERLVKAVSRAVRAAAEGLVAGRNRALPLVALPLVGTGNGGLRRRRGAVVAKLLPELRQVAEDSGVDVALVLKDARDFAAAQAHRTDGAWTTEDGGLTPSHLDQADDLGRRAASGELALFLGAGVSMPVGLPNWVELLNVLADAAGQPEVPAVSDLPDYLPAAASRIKHALGAEYHSLLDRTLNAKKHALAHGLLAGLGTTRMVTTNFDPCMELALAAVHGGDGVRVLTRHLATGKQPWLLKLHGDIAKPASVVLTTEDYKAMEDRDQALSGTVQGLMLTGHLLFVGYSLADKDFVKLATQVRDVRSQADPAEPQAKAGTVLALETGELEGRPGADDLRLVSMLDASVNSQDWKAAGRLLEVFLDRVAWTASKAKPEAAQYLLDERFDEGFTSLADIALRKELIRLIDGVSSEARSSNAWDIIEDALLRLGAEERIGRLPVVVQ